MCYSIIKEKPLLIERINASPIFYLSLSSRELFHTNFWKWLSEIDKEQAYRLFSDVPIFKISDVSFDREMQGIDLFIKNGKSKFYIENKVKSIPHPEQLERYRSKFDDGNSEFVLISLFKPCESFSKWNLMTYDKLAKKISAISPESTYHSSIINDYVTTIGLLSELAEALPNEPKYDYFINNSETSLLRTELESIKFLDTYLKYRGSLLAQFIYNEIKTGTEFSYQYGKIDKGDTVVYPLVFVDNGFNNKRATIDIKLALSKDLYIGVQIEGEQYRKFIETSEAKKKAIILAKHEVWFNNKWKSPRKQKKNSKDKESEVEDFNFCKYGERFQYQYTKMEYGASYKSIAAAIKKDFYMLINLREEIARLLI